MKNINYLYRHKNKVTDVLAFAALEGKKMIATDDFGDIFICLPQIKRQAKQYGVSQTEEFKRMLIHGLLHLLGYDHIKKNQAVKMLALQEKLVKKLI